MEVSKLVDVVRVHPRDLSEQVLTLGEDFVEGFSKVRRGFRELLADHARITRAKALGDAEYDAALTEWKLRSQVRLVAAQMTVDNQPELQKQLETLLTQGERAKRRQIQLQIKRQYEQIKRLRRRLEQDPARNVQRQLRAINKRVKPQSKKNKRRRK